MGATTSSAVYTRVLIAVHTYEVTKKLPESRGEFEYRIKSMNEPHERVVRESELQGV